MDIIETACDFLRKLVYECFSLVIAIEAYTVLNKSGE
jgi:hypothetical protein